MASPRTPSPIQRTYLSKSVSPRGKTTIHARIYAPEYDLDLRGTGRTVSAATKRALEGVPRPR